jgi:hypothetical protein
MSDTFEYLALGFLLVFVAMMTCDLMKNDD